MVDWIVPNATNSSSGIKNSAGVKKPENIKDNETTDFSNESSLNEIDQYQKYSTGTVSLKLPVGTIEDSYTFKENQLVLNSSLQNKVGSDSKYFELYFQNEELTKNTLDSSPVTITFQVDPDKKLLAVYKVGEDGSLKPLNYRQVNNRQIEVETTGLGKYILSYKEKDSISTNQVGDSNQSQNVDTSKNDHQETGKKESIQIFSNLPFWILGGGSLLLIGLVIYLLKRKSGVRETFSEINYN